MATPFLPHDGAAFVLPGGRDLALLATLAVGCTLIPFTLASVSTITLESIGFAIGADAAYGVAGLLGLAAIYYTFRDKGRPSIGVVDVRALALTPTVGPNYAGLSMELPW